MGPDVASAPVGPNDRWTAPAPLLVSLGEPDQDGQIYLDLETAGLTTLMGDPVLRLDLLRTIAAEVAHSPLAETAQVIVVGNIGSSRLLARNERTTTVDSWATAIDYLTGWAEQSRAALVDRGLVSPFVARAEDPIDDELVPLLVLGADPPPEADQLAVLLDGPHAVAAVAAVVIDDVPTPGSTAVVCEQEGFHLPDIGLTCRPRALDQEQIEQIAALLEHASDQAGTQLSLVLDESDHLGAFGGNGDERSEGKPYEDPLYEVLVRYLGEIVVEGETSEPLTPKQTAAVAS